MADPNDQPAQGVTVTLKGGTVLHFPAGMSQQDMQAAMDRFVEDPYRTVPRRQVDIYPDAGTSWGDRAALGIKMTPEGKAGYLEHVYGKGRVVTDGEGRYYLKTPNDSGLMAINPRGADWRDLAEVGAPAALEVGPALAAATNPVTVAGAAAAGNLARQGVSALLPGDDQMSLGDRALRTAETAVTAGVAQKGFNVAGKVIDKLRPVNIAKRYVQRLMAGPSGQQGAGLAQQTGIPLSVGQETGSRSLLTLEGVARRHPATADRMTAFDVMQLGKAEDALNAAFDGIDKRGWGPFETGQAVTKNFDDAVRSVQNIRRVDAQRDFGALHAASGGRPVIPVNHVLGRIDDLVKELDVPGGGDATATLVARLKALRSSWESAGGKPPVDPMAARMSGMPPQQPPAAPPSLITGEQAQRLLQVYTNVANGTGRLFQDIDQAQQRWIAREILKAVGADLDTAVAAGGQNGQVAQLLRTARDNYRNNSGALDELEQSVLGRLLGGKYQPSPEAVSDKLLRMKPSELRATFSILDRQDPLTAQAVRRRFLEDALERAQNNVPLRDAATNQATRFSARKFLGAMPDDRVLGALFERDPTALGEITRISQALERIAERAGTDGSPTAPLLWALDMAKGLVTSNPVTFLPGAAVQIIAPRTIARAMTTPEGRQALMTLAHGQGVTGPKSRAFAMAAATIKALQDVVEPADNVRPVDQDMADRMAPTDRVRFAPRPGGQR